MNKTPQLIGITGGIGAGKSTVATVFKQLGAPIYLADDRAKWLTANKPSIVSNVKTHFGEASYDESGVLNRAYLAKQIFEDPQRAKMLESWVHPAVAEDFMEWVKQHKDAPYVLKEAALLFEAGSYKDLDKVIVVTALDALRISRVLARDAHRDRTQVEAILKKQMPQEIKAANADFLIENSGQCRVIPQVLRIHQRLLEISGN